eukprot:282424-Prymnesium_polylepis.1
MLAASTRLDSDRRRWCAGRRQAMTRPRMAATASSQTPTRRVRDERRAARDPDAPPPRTSLAVPQARARARPRDPCDASPVYARCACARRARHGTSARRSVRRRQ